MLAVELVGRRLRWRCYWRELERALPRFENLLRFRWLGNHGRYAAVASQCLCLLLVVVRGPEDHASLQNARVGTKLANKLIAIHRRHQDVGNHQVGPFRPGESEGLSPIGSLKQAVMRVTEQYDHELA